MSFDEGLNKCELKREVATKGAWESFGGTRSVCFWHNRGIIVDDSAIIEALSIVILVMSDLGGFG